MLINKNLIIHLGENSSIYKASVSLIIADILYNKTYKESIEVFLTTKVIGPLFTGYFLNKIFNWAEDSELYPDPHHPIRKCGYFAVIAFQISFLCGIFNKDIPIPNKYILAVCLFQSLSNFNLIYKYIRKVDLGCTKMLFRSLEVMSSFDGSYENFISKTFEGVQYKCEEECNEIDKKNYYIVVDRRRVGFTLLPTITLCVLYLTQTDCNLIKYITLCAFNMVFEESLHGLLNSFERAEKAI